MIIFRLRELVGRWEVQQRRRLSFDDLARETGISAQVLSKMSDPAGGYATSSRHIDLLCQFFNVRPDELIVVVPDAAAGSIHDCDSGDQKADKDGNDISGRRR